MFKNKWLIGLVVLVVVVLAALWYQGLLPVFAVNGSADESAAVANAMPVTSAATALQKATTDISLAASKKDSAAVAALQGEMTAATNAVTAVLPVLQKAINAATNRGKDMSTAQAALKDIATKQSYLESGKLTLQNAQADLTNLNAIYSDISSIRSALQASR